MAEPTTDARPGRWPAWAEPLAAAALLAAHLALVVHGGLRHSATSDEVVFAPAGYARLTAGAADVDPEHPPLLKLLLGAAWLGARVQPVEGLRATLDQGLEYDFGHELTYRSPEPAPALLLRARLVVAGLSALLGLLVLLAARRLFGPLAGLLALALYAFDPFVVSHAGLATLDLGGALGVFAAAGALGWAVARGGAGRLLVAGALMGVALAFRTTALLLFPLLGLVVAAGLAEAEAGSRRREVAARLGRAVAVGAVGLAVLWVAYLPDGFAGLQRTLALQAAHNARGTPSFALGLYSRTGWWWYFPVAWLVKTPLALLLAGAAGAALVAASARARPTAAAVLLGAPALVLAAGLATTINIGLRHMLPAAPFLAVAGGAALARLAGLRWGRPVALGLAAWLAAETLLVHPDELAYANEVAGGPDKLYLRLGDSNVDWGQDLPALADALRGRKIRRLWLDYFGPGLPAAHGVPPYRLVRGVNLGEHPRGDGPDAEGADLIAVSAFHLMDVPYQDPTIHAWLRERRPIAFPGHSIALYDLTGDAAAYAALAQMARRLDDPDTWFEARDRLAELRERALTP